MISKTRKNKNKGKSLQNQIVKDLIKAGKDYGVNKDNIKSAIISSSGLDVILDEKAQKLFPFAIETKKSEGLAVVSTFWKHYKKYELSNDYEIFKLLIHSKNFSPPLVTMTWEQFLNFWSETKYMEW